MLRQTGQAMTETLITASMILVPLFLLIPLLGKYIDINHSTIQAARYEAWEYTVWYRTATEEPTGVVTTVNGNTNVQLPRKDFIDLQDETRQRFFSATDARITATDNTLWNIANPNNPNNLWKDHRDVRLLSNTGSIDSVADSSDNTPSGVTTALFNFIFTIFNTITSGVGSIISGLSGNPNLANFDVINLYGYSKSEITVPIVSPPGLIDFVTLSGPGGAGNSTTQYNLNFNSKAAVLSDGWNAGGKPHTINKAGGITVTKVINQLFNVVPVLSTLQTLIGAVAPEIRPCFNPPATGLRQHPFDPDDDGSLWLGYLDTEAIHPDRLQLNNTAIGSHQCADGMCEFTYNIPSNPGYKYPYADPNVTDECN